ncbi:MULTISPECIES: hypothetical protein [Mycolicibacter]|uniref:Uncharacterized protein n=2 Tax=Mycolicibacter TaxID=1073531 RepID=A0ABU5XN71_9MYCO|nr:MULTISPECIES: hypothetical protein [unclassified Mycolicibacter]MEB3023429.1 hypothetical protein [Mycolicibacter sp. MYC098]MEB3033771.1 hypothetical protein [Mycolicibacter sp. MYC340]
MGMQLLSRDSVTPIEDETVEVFSRPVGGSYWTLEAAVDISVDNLTEWLAKWLQDNNIDDRQWIAGNKWGGNDSAILTPGSTTTAAA